MTAASRATYRKLLAQAAAVRAARALLPRTVSAAEAQAVVRPATEAERAGWVRVAFGVGEVPAVGVEEE